MEELNGAPSPAPPSETPFRATDHVHEPTTLAECDEAYAACAARMEQIKAIRKRLEIQEDPEAYVERRIAEALAEQAKILKRQFDEQMLRVRGAAARPASSPRGKAVTEESVIAALESIGAPAAKRQIAARLGVQKESSTLSNVLRSLKDERKIKMDGEKSQALYSVK